MAEISQAVYSNDREELAKLAPDTQAAFIKYMDELDAEHAKRGLPYGNESLWKLTGAECWFGFFEDGYSAADALTEDLTYANE